MRHGGIVMVTFMAMETMSWWRWLMRHGGIVMVTFMAMETMSRWC